MQQCIPALEAASRGGNAPRQNHLDLDHLTELVAPLFEATQSAEDDSQNIADEGIVWVS